LKRANVVVHGSVQGVFRLAGWVRNAPDGTVEAVLEGDDEQVESMVEWCRRGPGGARVEEVEVAWSEPEGEEGFSIR